MYNAQTAPAIINSEIIKGTITAALAYKWTSYLDTKPKTAASYTRSIRQFINYLQAQAIEQPRREDIIAFREELKEHCKPATVQAYITAVKLFFRWTAQAGLYPNIADHIKGAKLQSGFKKDYLTEAQAKDLLQEIDRDTLQGKRDYAILSLMLTAGLRTVEVTRANIEDLQIVAGFTALYIQGKGRDEKSEFIKVAPPVEKAIREYLKERGEKDRSKPLFASISNHNGGGALTTVSVSRIAKTHLRAAGFDSERLTAHSLRHTAATLNLRNGGSIEETRQLLRHSNINTTLIYSHALSRESNQSEARIAKAIFGK